MIERIPLELSRMVCANGETIEWSLWVGNERVAGPVWLSSKDPRVAMSSLLARRP